MNDAIIVKNFVISAAAPPAFGVVKSVHYFFLFAANGCAINR